MFELKPLSPADLPAAVALDQLVLGGLWSLDGYRQELERTSGELLGLMPANLDPDKASVTPRPTFPPIIGMGCLWGILDEAHITLLVVHPDYRRQGLGQTLLWSLLQVARQRNLARATLEVRASNQAALHLYERFGFRVVGQRRRYYQDNGEDALILWRKGLQTSEFRGFLEDWHPPTLTHPHRGEWPLYISLD